MTLLNDINVAVADNQYLHIDEQYQKGLVLQVVVTMTMQFNFSQVYAVH